MPRIDRSLRIRKLVLHNPRQEHTHGWYAWECLSEGMTIQEYLDCPFDPSVHIRRQKRPGRPFTGPDIIHLQWDVDHGFCELYRDNTNSLEIASGQGVSAFSNRRIIPVQVQLSAALLASGFKEVHQTKKVLELQRGNLIVYLKLETKQNPLVLHPGFFDLAHRLQELEGVEIQLPVQPYINSNMRAFPVYEAAFRKTRSRYGFAISVPPSSISALTHMLEERTTITVNGERIRLFGVEENRLTERERLVAARLGQGEFRSHLIAMWNGVCPIAGIDHPELLRASHIKPWRDSSDTERLDPYNGLLLSAHIDALFDCGLISFEDSGMLLVSSQLGSANFARLGLGVHLRLGDQLKPRHFLYLAYHRREIFRG